MARILLADDDILFRKATATVLRSAGHQVEAACDGTEALTRFQHGRHELVFTDLIMPQRDGLQTIMALRRLDANIRILAISGGGPFMAVVCLPFAKELGARVTLARPFGRSGLLAAVESALVRG